VWREGPEKEVGEGVSFHLLYRLSYTALFGTVTGFEPATQ
jgi:hypothetical protein